MIAKKEIYASESGIFRTAGTVWNLHELYCLGRDSDLNLAAADKRNKGPFLKMGSPCKDSFPLLITGFV
jgi:hypothetical protein